MAVITKNKPLCFDGVDPDYYQGFENMNDHNLISFKSFNEVFNMEAIEELYGHFTNYKKIKDMQGLQKSKKINLYAVTHHFPKDLFNKFDKNGYVDCIIEDRVYDFNVFTKVRFIITKSFDHPILGLFSDNIEQIQKSLKRLEKDKWLLEHVSAYMKKIFEYYSLEGFDMAYTKEMFFKDYYPEEYDKILMIKDEIFERGMEMGMDKGHKKGVITEAKDMVLEVLNIRFKNVPIDIHKEINGLNNRILLKRLHNSAIVSKNINSFKKTIKKITSEFIQ